MTTHFVSIIIVSYNGISYLKDCIDSVLDQDYPRGDYEIIVADNASTDGSVDFLRLRYSGELRIIEYGVNHGFAKGNNLALRHARGELLVFLNQDTIVHRRWLSELVRGVTDAGYDVCHSNMLLPRNAEFDGAEERRFPKNIYYYELTRYGHVHQVVRKYSDDIIETRALAGGSFIIKKSVLDEVGVLFDECFCMYSEDTDLALRLVRKGFRIGVVPSSVVYHFTRFSFGLNRYNVWKNLIMVRNRMMAFWKSSGPGEFARVLPYLLASQPQKVFTRSREVKNSRIKSALLACSTVPLSLISLLWFIATIPKLEKKPVRRGLAEQDQK